MTKAQARKKAIDSIHRIGIVFTHGDCDCKELLAILESETAVLGLGRLMIQAAWMTQKTDALIDMKFRDVTFHLLYQCYLKQKPKRKSKKNKMSTPTVARPTSSKDSHWYTPEGEPCYSIMGKTTGRPRPVDIRDARANGYLPSVTTILRTLHKEALVNWMIEQAVLACLTTPRKMIKVIEPVTGLIKEVTEELDAFIERVLHVEKIQDEESQIARDKGNLVHDALEHLFGGAATPLDKELAPWVMPAYQAVTALGGKVLSTEQILVGDGYAGRTDLVLAYDNGYFDIWDFKSTKKLPDPKKGAWPEHRLQLSAYAQALLETQFAIDAKLKAENIRTRNLYVSTVNEGQFVICEPTADWSDTYWGGFVPLVQYWAWANKYKTATRIAAPVVEVAPATTADMPAIEALHKEFMAETKDTPPEPPRKRKVTIDVGVPTLQQPRFSPMAPPPMPNEP